MAGKRIDNAPEGAPINAIGDHEEFAIMRTHQSQGSPEALT